jgi:regulatory protein
MVRTRGSKTAKPNAVSKAVDLLSRREQSKRELKTKLVRGGYEKSEVDVAVQTVAARDYQSDARFSASLARNRVAGGYGPRRISAELKSHGIADADIAAAIGGVDADWTGIARRQLDRRYGRSPAADREERARRAQFLLRRGFDPATVRAVTRAEIDDPGEEFD